MYNMPIFLFHPPGITVNNIGMDCSTHSSSCYDHHICGSLLAEDVVVHFRRLQILVDKKEKSIIAAYHVSDVIGCCVGFLKSKLTKFSVLYEGMLGQVTSMCPGSSVSVITSCLPEEMNKQMTIISIDDTDS